MPADRAAAGLFLAGGGAAGGVELLRLHFQVGDGDVVLCTFAAFEADFNRVAHMGAQHRVGLAAVVDEHHLAVDDAGFERVLLDGALGLLCGRGVCCAGMGGCGWRCSRAQTGKCHGSGEGQERKIP